MHDKKFTLELFQNPTAEYRGAPFWAWNCALEPELLTEQIEIFKEMGFGGFFMHSRSGMATRYLGQEFMDVIRICAEKAKKESMFAYLYDEDRFPSGAAGGFVTEDKRLRMRNLLITTDVLETVDEKIGVREGKTYLLAVYDIGLNEQGELERYRRIAADSDVEGTKWFAYVRTMPESNWYNGKTYIDTLNPEATKRFLEITHEMYKKSVGDEFGKTIPAIFTDEPRFEIERELIDATKQGEAVFAWTPALPQTYREEYKEDILEGLPEIVWNLPHGKISRFRYRYHNHTAELFAKNFCELYGKWCSDNGIKFTGHMAGEEALFPQGRVVGDIMRCYPHYGIPGVDMLCDSHEYNTVKQMQSVARQSGKNKTMCELYGVTGWGFDFRGHKHQGDWLTAMGITLRVPHLAWASMKGEAKRDYPASVNYQVPWYREYKFVEDHFARLNTALTGGKPIVKVGVIHPIESFWLNMGPKKQSSEITACMQKQFDDLTEWLLFGQIDFDFICEATLPMQFGGINKGLVIGKMTYDAVIVSCCKTLHKTTVDVLKEFNKAGGRVIFTGDTPEYIEAELSNEIYELCSACIKLPFEKTPILKELEAVRDIRLYEKDGTPTDDMIYQMREDVDGKWLFLAFGKKRKEIAFSKPREIDICIEGEYTPRVFNTLTGEVCEVDYRIEYGKTLVGYTFYSHDSLLLKLEEVSGSYYLTDKEEIGEPDERFDFRTTVSYFLEEDNVLLLDMAEVSLDGISFMPEEEMLRADEACRKAMGMEEDTRDIQPWCCSEDDIVYVILRVHIMSDMDIDKTYLAMEEAKNSEVWLNGVRVDSTVEGFYVDKSIGKIKLPPIYAGENILQIRQPFGSRIGLENLYLLGNFAVKVRGAEKRLVKSENKIGFGSIVPQGFPFYGGNIRYDVRIDTPKCDMVVCVSHYAGALVKVIVDGSEAGIIAYEPYRLKISDIPEGSHNISFLLFGNRANTFGDLHNTRTERNNIHDLKSWTGPWAWHTKGEEWCYEYRFSEMGILSSPVIEIYHKNNN